MDFLGSGSAGNSTVIRWGDTRILIDAGFDPDEQQRRLAEVGLSAQSLDAWLITHEHADHIRGAAHLAQNAALRVCGPRPSLKRVRSQNSAWALEYLKPNRALKIGPLSVLPLSVPHDARGAVGFVIDFPDAQQLGYLTDLGHAGNDLVYALRNATLLAIETNHDRQMLREGPYPPHLKRRINSSRGHLCNHAAATFVNRIVASRATANARCAAPDNTPPRLRHIFCLHISQVNNHPDRIQAAFEHHLSTTIPLSLVRQDQILSHPAARIASSHER